MSDGRKDILSRLNKAQNMNFARPERDIVMYGENGEAVVSGRDKISHSMQAARNMFLKLQVPTQTQSLRCA